MAAFGTIGNGGFWNDRKWWLWNTRKWWLLEKWKMVAFGTIENGGFWNNRNYRRLRYSTTARYSSHHSLSPLQRKSSTLSPLSRKPATWYLRNFVGGGVLSDMLSVVCLVLGDSMETQSIPWQVCLLSMSVVLLTFAKLRSRREAALIIPDS